MSLVLIDGLIDLVFGLVSLILSAFDIPEFPPELMQVVNSLSQYIQMGIAILSNYCHMSYLLALFGIVLAVDVAILGYRFVMWILRKIPMLGIS